MTDLEIDIAEKRYPGQPLSVLSQFRLRLEPGRITALVGPSGCGKTTLLRLIAGLDAAYAGHIHARPERVSMVFQEPRLLPWRSLLDNLLLVAPEAPPDRARALLAAVGLGERSEAFPAQLSGGQQRRAALARAFITRPELLLLDEPFSSLDTPTADQMYQLLMNLFDAVRPTVLMVTHDLREALVLADRVVFIGGQPAQVIRDHPVDLPRPRQRDDAGISRAYHALLQTHAGLLSGREAA